MRTREIGCSFELGTAPAKTPRMGLADLAAGPKEQGILDFLHSRPPTSARSLALVAAVLALTLGVAPNAAASPSGSQGVRGMSEEKLKRSETGILGPEHAAEHARQRAVLRQRGRRTHTSSYDGRSPATPSTTSTASAAGVTGDPAQVGRWGAPFSIPILGIHAVMLPTGKVMWWAYPNGDKSQNTAQAWLWNPATGASKRVDPPLWRDPADGQLKPANIWCSGQSLLADGRVLVTGGNLAYSGGSSDFKGLNKVYTFNPWNETWTEQPDMPHGRWYPSQALLPDGRALILSGIDENGGGAHNRDVEIFTPSSDMDGRGTLTKLGERGGAGQPPDGGLYPHLFVMPSGRTMVAGPDPVDSWFLDPPGTANAFTWSNFANPSRRRLWGTAVLDGAGTSGATKVSLIGGAQPDYSVSPPANGGGVASSETFDESAASSGWQAGPSLNVGRGHHNTVQLPDGSMVTVGGGYGTRQPEGLWAFDPEHTQIELFDPATKTWRLGPSQAEGRAYHSTALLLPDGRVLSAGDDYNGGTAQDTGEIYEPPYLFKGARPTISAAPGSVKIGERFGVDTPDANVNRAVLVAPAAVTHAVDMNQRYMPLQLTQRSGGVDLVAPPTAEAAPPGYYMLFLLNDQGVPSIARWVRLLPGASAPKPTGLVAAYSFDEGSGSAAGDASGTDNQGTLAGPSWTSSGRFGSALSFDGLNDRVTVPDSSSLDLTTGMTLEAWLRPQSTKSWQTGVMKETSSNVAYGLYGTSRSNRPSGQIGKSSTTGPSALPADQWSHVAVTYDRSALRLYVNGNQVSSKGLTASIPTSSSPLGIGGNGVFSDQFFKGLIDEVRVYNRALSASEIQADKERAVGTQPSPPPPPPPDTTAPSVSITSPANGASVSGTIDVAASASDDTGVSGVQFKLDGANLGTEDNSSPYSASWDTRSATNGQHTLTAVARDAAGNTKTSGAVTVTVNNTATVPQGLVAAYSFDEGSGSTAGDSSGKGNQGTLSGAAWSSSGRFGSALSFDGLNDWVTVQDADSLDLTTGMTLEAWLRPQSTSLWQTAILKEIPNELAYAMYATSGSNRPSGWAGLGSTTGPAALPTDAWSHVAVTYDAATLRLYVNGSQVSSKAFTSPMPTSSGPLRIGGNGVWSNEFFKGLIDEVRVYNRALSASEVQTDRDRGVGG